MKKKGFTLVELLAVIAILAILVIMALPAVLRMFEQARVDSFNNELNTIVRTAKQQYLLEGGGAKTWSNAEGSTSKLSLTGGSNLKYSVTMDGTGKVTKLQATNGSYQYDKTDNNGIDIVDKNEIQSTSNLSGSEVLVIGDSNTKIDIATITVATPGSLSTNDEVEVEGDRFYVVSSSSTETVLLSKYLLNHSNSQQSNGTNTNILTFHFKDSNGLAYWDGCKYSSSNSGCTSSPSGLLSPYNNSYNNVGATTYAYHYPYVYDSNTSLKSYVDAYANKISTSSGVNVTGRLLSHEEAVSLSSDVRTPTNNTSYWFGSAGSYYNVWSIGTDGVFNDALYFEYKGIRPVIVINTDKINLTQGSSGSGGSGGSSGPGSSSGSGSSNRTYTLTYNCNGGSGTAPASTTVSSGTHIVSSNKPCGYKINTGSGGRIYYQSGWATSPTGSAVSGSISIYSNMTLYAAWSELYTYTGTSYVYNDGSGNWRVEFRTSGTLTMRQATAVDIHAVGGGGGGGGTSLVNYSAGGGGGGYTTTVKNRSLSASSYTITVGAGGSGGAGKTSGGAGSSGTASSFGSICTANGGSGGTASGRWFTGNGGNGGSGGGSGNSGTPACTGAGGSNGSNGTVGTLGLDYSGASAGTAGTGQGTTTRDFGETTGTLRAGGGGGGCGKQAGPAAAGGNNGGGSGGLYGSAGSAGTANYGGGGGGGANTANSAEISSGAGGAGGSGIVIMRNKR